jgi:hypothetical protein
MTNCGRESRQFVASSDTESVASQCRVLMVELLRVGGIVV